MDARSFLNTCWRLSIIVLKFPAMNIQNTPSRFLIALSVASAVFAVGLPVPAFGQSYTWTGAAGDLWSDSANWSPAGVPGSLDTVIFDASGGLQTAISLNGTAYAKYLIFDPASASHTVGASGDQLHTTWTGAITLEEGLTQNQTIGASIIQLNADGAQNASYNFVNNSSASLNTAAHIFPGPGGTSYTLYLKGTGNGINTLSGVLSDNLEIAALYVWLKGGVWALTGLNSFSGWINLEGGTLVANTVANTGQASSLGTSNSVNFQASSTFQYTGGPSVSDLGFFINTGLGSPVVTATIDITGGPLTLNGGTGGTGALQKTGAGQLTLAATDSDFNGATIISGGILGVASIADGGKNSSIGKSSADASNLVFDGGTLQYTGGPTHTNRGFTITDGKMAVFDIANDSGVTFSGNVPLTTGGISLIGGSLLLSGYNQYTGPTTVSGSTLIAGSNSGPFGGPLGVGSDVTLTAGATLSTQTISSLMIGSLSGEADTQVYFNPTTPSFGFTINSSHDATFAGVIYSIGGITKLGNGTQTLSGSNLYQGATIIQGGGITLSGANGSIASSTSISISGNGTLALENFGNATNPDRIGDTASIAMSGGTLTFETDSSAPSASETIGNLTVTGGYNTISNGLAGFGKTSTLTIASLTRSGGAVVNFAGSSLGFNAENRILFTAAPTLGDWALYNGVGYAAYDPVNGIVETAYADVTRLSSGSKVICSAAEGNIRIIDGTGTPGAITLNGSTTTIWTLSQSATGGNAMIDTGGKTLGLSSVLVGAGAGGLTIGTGVNSGNLTAAVAAVTLINNSNAPLLINSTVADLELQAGPFSIGLTASGSGNTTLAGTNTYTGVTTLGQGVLSVSAIGNGGVAGNLGAASNSAANIVFSGGTLRYTGNATTTDRGFTVAWKGSRLETSANLHFSGAAINLASDSLEIGGTGNTTITSIMSGSGGLVKADSSTLTLEGANTFTGGVTIRGGSVSVATIGLGGYAGNLGASSFSPSNLVLDGGILVYTGADFPTDRGMSITANGGTFVNSGAGTNIVFMSNSGNDITIAQGGVFTVDGPGWVTLQNEITGPGALRKSGDGYLRLEAPVNLFTGGVTISGGALGIPGISDGGQAGFLGAASADPANLVFDGGTLTLSTIGTTQTTDRGFSIAGGKTATFTVANNSSLRLSGSVPVTTGGLTMAGNGKLILAGNMSYSGTTTVSAGTLVIDGTLGSGSSVFAAAGATLGGSGTIHRDVYISGTHSPGSSPGVQTIEGAVIYNPGATVDWELAASTTEGRGTNYDGINGDGHVAHFLGATALNLVFNAPGSTVKWSDGLWGANRQWVVYSGFAVLGFENLGIATFNWADSTGALFSELLPGSAFSLAQSGNDIVLNYTGVPEPASAVLIALGVLTIAWVRHRKKPARKS